MPSLIPLTKVNRIEQINHKNLALTVHTGSSISSSIKSTILCILKRGTQDIAEDSNHY